MKILVFSAKWVGIKCIEYLLERFPGDSYEFVLADPDLEIAEKTLEQIGLPYKRLSEKVVKEIGNRPDGHYDWLLNLWGGHIFKQQTLSKVKNSVNLHPALLPYCRGRDPVVWAIRKEYPAGATLHQISTEVDAGPIWCQTEVKYDIPIRGEELYKQVVMANIDLFRSKWPDIRCGKLVPSNQPVNSSFPPFRRSDLIRDRCIDLDSDKSARDFVLRILSHDYRPGYTLQMRINGKLYNATIDLQNTSE